MTNAPIDFTADTDTDFSAQMQGITAASMRYLADLGIEPDMSNAVTTPVLGGGYTIENERNCPHHVSHITPGWWFTRGRLGSGLAIDQVKDTGSLEYVVLRVGDENITETVSEAVAVGVRFISKVEFPEGV